MTPILRELHQLVGDRVVGERSERVSDRPLEPILVRTSELGDERLEGERSRGLRVGERADDSFLDERRLDAGQPVDENRSGSFEVEPRRADPRLGKLTREEAEVAGRYAGSLEARAKRSLLGLFFGP